MSKTFFITLVTLFFSLSVSCQIRREFWGLTIGLSTKQQVYNTITRKGYKLTWSAERNTYEAKSINFAGHFWPFFAFEIYNGRLMSITFLDATLSTASETLDIVYDTFKTKLKTKYKGMEKPLLKDTYSDGITSIDIMRYYVGGEKFISLGYTDEVLYDKYTKDGTDDL